MLGLVVIAFIAAYLVVSVLVVWLTVRWARRHNLRPWVWGGLAAFAMYNLVFWDWIPTVAMHRYYCATEAGFWVYKTPEQWVKENPGMLERLSINHLPEQFRINPDNGNLGDSIYMLPDGTRLVAHYRYDRKLTHVDFVKPNGSSGYWLNERIGRLIKQDKLPLGIMRFTEELLDFRTGKSLVRYVSYGCTCRFSLVGSGCDKDTGRGIGTWLILGFIGGCQCPVKNSDLFQHYVNTFQGGKR